MTESEQRDDEGADVGFTSAGIPSWPQQAFYDRPTGPVWPISRGGGGHMLWRPSHGGYKVRWCCVSWVILFCCTSSQTTLQQNKTKSTNSFRPDQTRPTRHSEYTVLVFVFESEIMFVVQEFQELFYLIAFAYKRAFLRWLQKLQYPWASAVISYRKKILHHSKWIHLKFAQNAN